MPNDDEFFRIEAGLRRISRRAFALEKRLAGLQRKDKDPWDKLAVFMPVIQALLLSFIAYLLVDSVNQALRERELELSNVKEMRESLLTLYSPSADSTELTASALALTAFGRYAVAPLILALETGANQNVAAERSLRALGTSQPRLVCEPIARIVENRRQGYTVETLISAVRLARALDCREAEKGIGKLGEFLTPGTSQDALLRLEKIVSAPAPTTQHLSDLREAIKRALPDTGSAAKKP